MAKDMELLQKMELTDESRAKLTALLEEAKKTKKVASKALVEALDAADATEEQTEQFYECWRPRVWRSMSVTFST